MYKDEKSLTAGRQGFTLIELLVVIAIVGVLAAAIIVGIDPLDKLNAANDSKVQNDIGSVATAMESYAVLNGNTYPAALSILTGTGDLRVVPSAPGGYSAYTPGAGGISQTVWGQLKSKRYTGAATPSIYWIWCSSSGKAGAVSNTTQCP